MRAKANPNSLLRGYHVCLAKHIQPSSGVLSTVIKSAGGNVSIIHHNTNVDLGPILHVFTRLWIYSGITWVSGPVKSTAEQYKLAYNNLLCGYATIFSLVFMAKK